MIACLLCIVLAVQLPEKPVPAVDEAASVRARIEKALKAAKDRLEKSDPGQQTRDLQKTIVIDLDQLIQLLQNPPPQNQQPPNRPPGDSPDQSDRPASGRGSSGKGGNESSESAPSKSRAGGNRRERKSDRPPGSESREGAQSNNNNNKSPTRGGPPMDRGPRPGDEHGQAGSNPDQASGATMENRESNKPEKLGDMHRDVWGHLPESLRQEVDHYYRERFMPKYRDLLRQYYTKLAEADRKKEPKK